MLNAADFHFAIARLAREQLQARFNSLPAGASDNVTAPLSASLANAQRHLCNLPAQSIAQATHQIRVAIGSDEGEPLLGVSVFAILDRIDELASAAWPAGTTATPSNFAQALDWYQRCKAMANAVPEEMDSALYQRVEDAFSTAEEALMEMEPATAVDAFAQVEIAASGDCLGSTSGKLPDLIARAKRMAGVQ